MPMTMTALIEQISRMTKDGECPECHHDATKPNPECEAHDEGEAFAMDPDDAVMVVNGLISLAREAMQGQEGFNEPIV